MIMYRKKMSSMDRISSKTIRLRYKTNIRSLSDRMVQQQINIEVKVHMNVLRFILGTLHSQGIEKL